MSRCAYRGLVRNVEAPFSDDLPAALGRIADVVPADAGAFAARLARARCVLLHLAEGRDARARAHFGALRLPGGRWALGPALAGIHCAALTGADLRVMADHGAAMVWSPLSNLLLYARTARVECARRHGVRIALGSDWSPTGSKNLLGELKVARLAGRACGAGFSDEELVGMVTRVPAQVLGWEGAVGTLEAGKLADLVVVRGDGPPASVVVGAGETAVELVMIGGVPRVGTPEIMRRLGVRGGERIRVGREARVLDLNDREADPLVRGLTLGEARRRLQAGLRRIGRRPGLPGIGRRPVPVLPALASLPERPASRDVAEQWFLAEDHTVPGSPAGPAATRAGAGDMATGAGATATEGGDAATGAGATEGGDAATGAGATATGPGAMAAWAAGHACGTRAVDRVAGLRLDPLTVADDPGYFEHIAHARNVPACVREGLERGYR